MFYVRTTLSSADRRWGADPSLRAQVFGEWSDADKLERPANFVKGILMLQLRTIRGSSLL